MAIKEIKVDCPYCKHLWRKQFDIKAPMERLSVVCERCLQYFTMMYHEDINK